MEPFCGWRGFWGAFCRPVRLPWREGMNEQFLVYSRSYAKHTKRATHIGRPFWYETMCFLMVVRRGLEPRTTRL